MRWIFDGNNLIYRIPSLQRLLGRDFEQARQGLVDYLSGMLGDQEVGEIVVVFDGRGDREGRSSPFTGLTVVYSSSVLSADAVIERWVLSSGDPARCRVVTSDRVESDVARAAGAETMSCGVFLDWYRQRRRSLDQWLWRRRRSDPGPRLGDAFAAIRSQGERSDPPV